MAIKNFIEKLGFIGDLFTYSKEFKLHNYTIRIDLQKGKIFYRKDEKTTVERQEDGQIQLGDHTTSNFSAPESLVVLECVNRLLEKGYSPHDIHIERRWKVGHGASGGKADINVYGKDGKTLLIIECKTYGFEFEKEKSKMEEHGGQLFTYLNQDKNAQFLVLYASKLENDEFVYNNLIVQIKDRKEDLEKSLKQIEEENIKLYRDANNKSELFEVWKESFNKYFHFNGIFDADANAYSLELKALKKKNLKNLDDAKGLFNKFAEILRHNNISDNANAFNRVLSLFLCKIVDEEKKDEDVLDFQVKEDEESEHIIDRLQALYQKGMAKLKEEIIYYSENEIHDIIKLYPVLTPIEKVEEIFRELKYYTNNEFAFKEVHNKKLFKQNARVLVEVIKLIQNYQFRFTSKQQVLGDFFELMVNHGVKQSEGQFFTPIPIVRYIILSLGFENIINRKIKNDDIEFLPKILDYACGAGHFLTESIEELQQVLKRIDEKELTVEVKKNFRKYIKGTEWATNYIFGIEKDYRLARTSQIACYINGDGDANIIFGDGLEEHTRLSLDEKKFDIVIANPPYSVDSFKNYLNIGRTHYDLFESLTERSKEIEVLFIERTKQVLTDGGLAGIILPSSILSNTGLYSKAREILLKHFEIKGITELGSKTFIATGTTTVILFLKRRCDDFYKDRKYIADDLFNNVKYAINQRYISEEIFLKMFTAHRNLNLDDYKRFLIVEANDTLAKTEMFKEYRNAFDNSAEYKQLQTKNYFKNYSKEEKEKELTKRFYEYCKEKEKEKFLYFMLCLGDGNMNPDTINDYYKHQQIIIVKTGKEIEEQKDYLGYEFIGRKGQEGIKIDSYGGKMFDETNYENPAKANSYIRKTLHGATIGNLNPEQENNISVYNLVDLIDFNRVEFEKVIKTEMENRKIIISNWKTEKFENCLVEIIGAKTKIEQSEFESSGKIPIISQESNKLISGYTNKNLEPITDLPLIVFGDHTCNFKYIDFNFVRGADGVVLLKPSEEFVPKYLYYYLQTLKIEESHKYMRHFKHLKRIDVPIPTKDIQQNIVEEIEVIEKKEKSGIEKIEKLEKEINNSVINVTNKLTGKFIDFAALEYGSGLPEKNRIKGEYPVMGSNGVVGYHNEYLVTGPAIIIGRKGSAGKIVYQEKNCYPIDTTFYVKLIKEIPLKYFNYYIKTLNLEKLGAGVGVPGLNRNDVYDIQIQLPSIDEQKKLVSIIDKKEKEIEKLKLALSTVEVEKEDVLKKYL